MLGRFKNKNYKKQWNSRSRSHKDESLLLCAWTDLRTRAHAQLHKHTSVNNNMRTYTSCFFIIIIQFATTYYDDSPPDDSSSNPPPPRIGTSVIRWRHVTAAYELIFGRKRLAFAWGPASARPSRALGLCEFSCARPALPPRTTFWPVCDCNNILCSLFLIFSCFFFKKISYVF